LAAIIEGLFFFIMKTIENVKSDIAKINILPMGEKSREQTKNNKLAIFYKDAIAYLETQPSEDFVKKQKEKVDKSIFKIEEVCSTLKTKESVFKYKEDNEYKKLLFQSKMLHYLLS
jgi:hypothetical protein